MFEQNEDDFESEKTQLQICSEAKNDTSERWRCRKFCVKNSDLLVKMLKNIVIFQKLSFKIAPSIYFRKVVLENQVSYGLKCL